MLTGRSLLPVFGAWVAWVYVLSLVVLRPLGGLGEVDPPLRPMVRFIDSEEVFRCDLDAGADGLAGVVAELSEPLDERVEIPVAVIPVAAAPQGVEAARPDKDYAADRDAVFVFEAGERQGRLRRRDDLPDVTVNPDPTASVARRFRLRLEGTGDVVVAADPQGLRDVEIPAVSASPETVGNRAQFRDLLVDVDEKDLADHRFVIEAVRPAEAEADLKFSLYRQTGSGQVPVGHFTGTFPTGAKETSFSLRQLLPAEELERLGVAYDPRPGVDEWYELHLDARPPLISATDPCFATIFCRDRDAPATVSFEFEDERGEKLARVRKDQPFFVTAELSRPIEVDCPVVPVVEGTRFEPGGMIPAGERRSERMGPFRLPGTVSDDLEEVLVGLAAEPPDGSGRCRACGDRPGGCDACRGSCKRCGGSPEGCKECRPTCGRCDGSADCPDCKAACKRCSGRPGGCRSCRGPCPDCKGSPEGCAKCRGKCATCGDRDGGCAACGFGSGKCAKCQGKPGPCSVCGKGTCPKCEGKPGPCGECGKGACPKCEGKPGPCSACGGGGQSPVAPPPGRSLANGPPVPGDFMIFLVNNQRLHEPGDVITDRVREAIKDRNPYKQGVIVINGDGKESLLTETSEPPAPERTFEPFSRDAQDLGGQTRQIVETVARKRRNAENPDIRTLVVWPEREFVSASDLAVFGELANDGRGPVSFLLPDADPERARQVADALVTEAGAGEVTVRSPKAEELVEHIDDVLDVIAAKPEDRLNRDEEQP